ncbi:MAG TPA: GDSL-type esterase/lipase family protein, partial [Thermodesulfobacteriota bacterium]|nr:GDSL-type esterase/lipase family protein [Thermodesulfobacteriota bacterium]
IFISIGGNNILNRHESVIVNDIAAIINRIRVVSPGTVIFFHSILPCKYDFTNSLAEAYNPQIQALCNQQGVTFINIYSLFKNSKTTINLNYYQADGIHLNDAGYQLWANTIKPLVVS